MFVEEGAADFLRSVANSTIMLWAWRVVHSLERPSRRDVNSADSRLSLFATGAKKERSLPFGRGTAGAKPMRREKREERGEEDDMMLEGVWGAVGKERCLQGGCFLFLKKEGSIFFIGRKSSASRMIFYRFNFIHGQGLCPCS
jgi:hypothetical protein